MLGALLERPVVWRKCFRSVAHTRLKVDHRLPSGFWSLPRRNASFSHQAARCRLTGWSGRCSCRAWGKSSALPIAPCSFRNRRSSACASGCIGTIQVRRTGKEQGPRLKSVPDGSLGRRAPPGCSLLSAGVAPPSCEFGFRIGPSFDEHHSVPESRPISLGRHPRVDVFDPDHLAGGKGS
jgi:hypothetical protein